jgi:hypothetical protein
MVRTCLRVALALVAMAPAGAWAAETEASPGPPTRVLVVAKIKEEGNRRKLEEEAKIELRDRGVEATLGSDVLVEEDFSSEDAIRRKASGSP